MDLSIFTRQFRYEDRLSWVVGQNDDNADFAPTAQDLPAIGILPGPSSDPWVLNQSQEFRYGLSVQLWFPNRDLQPVEKAIEDVVVALFDDDHGTNPILEATGQYPSVVAFAPVPASLGDARIWLGKVNIETRTTWTP